MTQVQPTPAMAEAPPPPAPRAVTPAAARRAWMEPRVRSWWIVAATLLVVAVGWSARQYLAWHRQASLVRGGHTLEATIWVPQDFGAGNRIPRRSIQRGAAATLAWTVDGTEHTGQITATETMTSGTTTTIWLDPDDPTRWTADGQITPLSRELVVLIVLVPALLLSALVAWIARLRVLSIWKNGEAQRAVAAEARLSGIAPLSRQVRCSLLDIRDKRLLTVTIPARKGVPARGEAFYVLVPPGQPTRAIAARAFA